MVLFNVFNAMLAKPFTMVMFRVEIMKESYACNFFGVEMIHFSIILCLSHIVNDFCRNNFSAHFNVELKGELLYRFVIGLVIPDVVIDVISMQGVFMKDF